MSDSTKQSGNFLENLGSFVLFVALMVGLRWLRGDFNPPKPELKLHPYLHQLNTERPMWNYEPLPIRDLENNPLIPGSRAEKALHGLQDSRWEPRLQLAPLSEAK